MGVNWSLRRSERMDTDSADAPEMLPKQPVQGDRLVPWSTSDGHSERRKKLPFTGNFEAHGRIDDIIALVACHSAVSDISILPDVAPSLRRN